MENKRQVYKLDIKAIEEYVYRANMFNAPDGNIDKKGIFKRQNGLVLLNLHQYIRMFKQEVIENDIFEIPDFVNILITTDSSIDDLSNKHIIFPHELILIASARDLEEKPINKLNSRLRHFNINFNNCILDFSKCYRLNKLGICGIKAKYIESIILHDNIKELYSDYFHLYVDDFSLIINNLYAPGVEKIYKEVFYNIKILHINLKNLTQISSNSLEFDGVIDNIIINIDGWVEEKAINPDCVNNLYLPYFCNYITDEDFNRYKSMLESTYKINSSIFLCTLNKIRKEVLNSVNSYVRNDDTALLNYYQISYLYTLGNKQYIDNINSLLIFREKINKQKSPMNILLYNGLSYNNNILNRQYKKVQEIINKYNNTIVAIVWEEV